MYIYITCLSRIRKWEMLSDHPMEMFQFRVLVTKHVPDKIAISLHVSIGSRVNGNVRSRTSVCHPDIIAIHSLTNHIRTKVNDLLLTTTYPFSTVSVKLYKSYQFTCIPLISIHPATKRNNKQHSFPPCLPSPVTLSNTTQQASPTA